MARTVLFTPIDAEAEQRVVGLAQLLVVVLERGPRYTPA